MRDINITNSFRIRTKYDLEELKAIKIKALKDLTYQIITEKYPLYKQINSGKSGIMEVAQIRAKCNKIEQDIKNCDTVEKLATITITEEFLRNRYVC